MNPLYLGMPPTERKFRVKRANGKSWGEIVCGGPCKDDYARIEIYHQIPGQRYVKLQAAAMRSFKDAEVAIKGKIFLTGSGWRACSTQSALYRSDSSRYANPNTTGHCRGLCIDVSTNQSQKKLAQIKKALLWRHWHQSRPVDEPWHYSFGIQV